MPERIQLRRTKGWRKPAGALVVARPSRWGNPFRVGDVVHRGPAHSGRDEVVRDAAHAVRLYRRWLNTIEHSEELVPALRGKDLACWCPPGQPCHADVLLEIANAEGSSAMTRNDETARAPDLGESKAVTLRGISFGAGVQSTALYLMALAGEVDADFAIFADTQDEPVAVYEHLWRMAELGALAGFPLYVVTAGRLSDEARRPGTFVSVPVFGRNEQGEDAQLRRQCSYQFKLRPMRAFVKANLLAKGQRWECLIGISTNELGRAKPSGRQWVVNTYPLLIDKRMSRLDCYRYCADRGVFPPRSACVFCPYRTDDEWRDLTAEEFEQACDFDDALRLSGGHGGRFGDGLFVHDSMRPLREVDLATVEDRGQGTLFARGDCMGLCGV